jgi:hypothetical protein
MRTALRFFRSALCIPSSAFQVFRISLLGGPTMFRVVLLACVLLIGVSAVQPRDKAEKKAANPLIGHMVYFKLKTASAENKQKLVDACKKYLSEHEGTVFFSAGVLADSFKREVNDRNWDVALHLIFVDKAAHDKYQDHPEHLKFIEENKDNWANVRVFDSEFNDYKLAKKK